MPQLAASPFEYEPEVLKMGGSYFSTTQGDTDAFEDVDLNSEDGVDGLKEKTGDRMTNASVGKSFPNRCVLVRILTFFHVKSNQVTSRMCSSFLPKPLKNRRRSKRRVPRWNKVASRDRLSQETIHCKPPLPIQSLLETDHRNALQ
jgi:hypothetical protein